MFSPIYFTSCQAALSFEHEDDKRTCFSVQTCLLHIAPESIGGEGPGDQEGSCLQEVQLQRLRQDLPQAVGCTLQLLPLHLCFHSVFPPRMKELGCKVPALCPILAEVLKHTCLLSLVCPEDTPLPAHWLFGTWTPASFLLQSKQQFHLASWNPVQN